MNIAFVDVETTGLDPHRHTVLEIALILEDDREFVWWIEPTKEELGQAEPSALRVNEFYHRTQLPNKGMPSTKRVSTAIVEPHRREYRARQLCGLTDGLILAGNNPQFDREFLEAWLRRHGACPTWNYHVLDVPVFAAGVLKERFRKGGPRSLKEEREDQELMDEALRLPFKASRVTKGLDIPQPEDRHTARADARWSKAMWEAVA